VDIKSLGNKIVVLGSPGSGKTHFSRQLTKQIDIKTYQLDDLFWKSKWQPVSEELFLQKLLDIMQKDSWIIDGNYSKFLEVRTKYADTIIFIDTPVIICLYRVIMRVIKLRFLKEHDSTLPKDIVHGIKQGNTKMFDDFWGLIKFVVLFPLIDKKLIFNHFLNYKKCQFIRLSHYEAANMFR
jgi:adenylate kinase family enzyme